MQDGRGPDGGEAHCGEQFMALYSSHQRRLYLYTVTLMCGAVDADDVFQEANLVLWQKFDQYREGTNFFAWACQIIRNKAMKHREKRARAAQLLDPDVFDRMAELAVAEVEHLDEFHRRVLADCMSRLSPGDRELMRQRYAESMPVQTMAASLDRSPNAVSKSLGRIRRLLLECITRAVDSREGGSRLPDATSGKGDPP